MRTMRGWTRGLLAMALVLGMAILLPLPAQAGVVGLDFEGLQDLEPINNFYNGGRGGFGSGPRPSSGIVFSSTSLAVIDMDQGGSADIANEPSGKTIVFFLDPAGAILNVPAGFETGFSFFYGSVDQPGSIGVFDGPGGTGTLLTSLTVDALGTDCGRPDRQLDWWKPIGVAFDGMAESIVFAGESSLAQAELRRPARQAAAVIVSSLSDRFNSAAVRHPVQSGGHLQGLDHLSDRGRPGLGGGGGDQGAGMRA